MLGCVAVYPFFNVGLDLLNYPHYGTRFQIILDILAFHLQIHSIKNRAINGIVLLLFFTFR